MMPFRKNLQGYPLSKEGDRKNVIKQTKVRTIIKSDNSWIHKPDDTEGQTIELPLSEEDCSAGPPLETPQKDKPPPPKPSSGYIIRGVFTKTIDSTSVPKTQYQDTLKTPKRFVVPEKPVPASMPRVLGSGYKVSSDDYSKMITKASSKPLQKSAPWEHSYVLSASKKKLPAIRVLPSTFPFKSSAQYLKSPFMARRVEVKEDEVPRERSKTLPSLSRQGFGFTSSDSNRDRAGSSPSAGNVSRSLFPSPRVQEYSEKREETATHDPKMGSILPDPSPETSPKRTFLEYKERNISGTRGDIPREEDEDFYPKTDRSSTWSNDSIHGSSSSQHNLDEIEIISKKGSTFRSIQQYFNSIQGGGYAGHGNQQPVEAKEPRFASSSSVSSTDQRFRTLPSVDSGITSDHRSTHSGYQERSVTTTVRDAGWDSARLAGAKGGIYADPALHYSDYGAAAPDCAHQQSLKDSSQESSSRRFNAVICTSCYKEIRYGFKIVAKDLGICCHEGCFKCEICKRKLSDMLDQVYTNKGIIYCDQCYARLF